MGSFEEAIDRTGSGRGRRVTATKSPGEKAEVVKNSARERGKVKEKPGGGKAGGRPGIRLTGVLREKRGMITVYLSLVFMLLMAVSFCVIEGVRDYQLSTLEEDSFISGGRAVLANYDKELYSHYQLFFLDPRERNWLEAEAREAMNKRFLQDSFYAASCQDLTLAGQVCATDSQGQVLHQQIRELMKYEPVGAAAEKLTSYIGQLQAVDYDSNRERVEKAEEQEKQAREKRDRDGENGDRSREQEDHGRENGDRTGEQEDHGREMGDRTEEQEDQAGEKGGREKEKGNRDGKKEEEDESDQEDQKGQTGKKDKNKKVKKWKALKRTITGIISKGILNYVVDKPSDLSHAHLPAGGLPSHMDDRGGRTSVSIPAMSFSGIGYLSGYFSHNPAKDYRGSVPLEDMMDITYACSHFNRFGERVNKDSILRYEMEYLCIGRSSDLDNLKGTVRRIMLIRYACNFAFACSDSTIGQEAEVLAGFLAGALGMPQLASTVKMLYIGALSYGETLLDLHSLLAGGRIPLIKSADSWNLYLANASKKLLSKTMAKPGKYNVDYENYLQLLLLLQRKRTRLLYRMMDLMQVNIRQREEGFFMKDCLFSFRLQGSFRGAKWFPLIPGMDLVSDRIMETQLCRTFSY